MSAAPGFRYIVLAEQGGGPHWVCIRRPANPDWLQVVARFANASRAEQYADVENDMAVDDPDGLRGDELKGQPALIDPGSNLAKALRGATTKKGRAVAGGIVIEWEEPIAPAPLISAASNEDAKSNEEIDSQAEPPEPEGEFDDVAEAALDTHGVEPTEPAQNIPENIPDDELVDEEEAPTSPPHPEPPSPEEIAEALQEIDKAERPARPATKPEADTDIAKRIAELGDKIAANLARLMKSNEEGMTYRDLREWTGARDSDVRKAVDHVVAKGLGRLVKFPGSTAYHLVPMDFAEPDQDALPPQQAKVLAVLQERIGEDGRVQISNAYLSGAADVPFGSVAYIIEALTRKGLVAIVGGGPSGTIYEVDATPLSQAARVAGSTAPGIVKKFKNPDALTINERKALSAMAAAAVDGIIQMPLHEISKASGVPNGSLLPIIRSLETKGEIVFVERGRNGQPSKYRVICKSTVAA